MKKAFDVLLTITVGVLALLGIMFPLAAVGFIFMGLPEVVSLLTICAAAVIGFVVVLCGTILGTVLFSIGCSVRREFNEWAGRRRSRRTQC
jgi:hypothetical protein